MSVDRSMALGEVVGTQYGEAADRRSIAPAIARGWLALLIVVAPFEAQRAVVQLGWQSVTTVELVLLAGLIAWLAISVVERRAIVSRRDGLAWALFVGAALVCAIAAPDHRTNALHMSARFGLMAALCAATVSAGAEEQARRRLVTAAVASGAAVAVLVIADFLGVGALSKALEAFRDGTAVVGAQVRASGPFQYPTIASMFLEISFALGLGLLVTARDRVRSVVLVVVLGLMAEAIVLTFTRSGLITIALALMLVGYGEWRRTRLSRSTVAVAAVAVLSAVGLFTSRSTEMLVLRLTSEGQGRWFSALIDAPDSIALDTRETLEVPVTITNVGRATWDSNAAEPVRLSYHWIEKDSDIVAAWEGFRTDFPAPVRAGESVSLMAKVGSTGRAGSFRLLWDIEQEGRLWFSTEPEARLVFSAGTISGPRTGGTTITGPRRIPRAAVRPGRGVLWRAAARMFAAHPVTGVGPDNFRLLYGAYSTLAYADPRVHSNNMFIELAAGMGLLGVAMAGWMVARIGRQALRARAAGGIGSGVAAACAAIAVHGMADSFLSFTGTYILIAVTLGLASASAIDDGRDAHRV